MTAVLGSCIAVCAYDDVMEIGGMNHVLLPGSDINNSNNQSSAYGTNLMELLFNELYSKGARRGQLKLKLFGGANLFNSGIDAGRKNVDFILGFAENEGLNVISTCLGGQEARQVEFHPGTGRTRQRFIVEKPVEVLPVTPPKQVLETGNIELF